MADDASAASATGHPFPAAPARFRGLSVANLAVKFLLELAALALFGYWGAGTGKGVGSVVLALAAPAAMMLVWGVFAAPRSTRRLVPQARIPLELSVFGLAAVAGHISGETVLAIVFAIVAAANAVGLTLLRQWQA